MPACNCSGLGEFGGTKRRKTAKKPSLKAGDGFGYQMACSGIREVVRHVPSRKVCSGLTGPGTLKSFLQNTAGVKRNSAEFDDSCRQAGGKPGMSKAHVTKKTVCTPYKKASYSRKAFTRTVKGVAKEVPAKTIKRHIAKTSSRGISYTTPVRKGKKGYR